MADLPAVPSPSCSPTSKGSTALWERDGAASVAVGRPLPSSSWVTLSPPMAVSISKPAAMPCRRRSTPRLTHWRAHSDGQRSLAERRLRRLALCVCAWRCTRVSRDRWTQTISLPRSTVWRAPGDRAWWANRHRSGAGSPLSDDFAAGCHLAPSAGTHCGACRSRRKSSRSSRRVCTATSRPLSCRTT